MVLTLAMSFAVTSSIVWWYLRPLIAAYMPRIIGASHSSLVVPDPRSGDLGDRTGVDAVGAADPEDGLAVLGGDALNDAGAGRARGIGVGDVAADQADRVVEGRAAG